ncbi:MAG: UPF0175 family protein [Candidatus Sumerlaeota bacterium]|nr:UPF0175 family protein [Candidatus Sumerlaeota bacterium]
MTTIELTLDDDLTALLRELKQPLDVSARELIVLELFRRGLISSGKAAEFLQMPRTEFIHYLSRLGIPFFAMTEEEWKSEREQSEKL